MLIFVFKIWWSKVACVFIISILITIARQGLRLFAKTDIMDGVIKVHRGPEVWFRTELFEKVKASPMLQYDLQGYLDTIPLRRMTNSQTVVWLPCRRINR